MSINLSRNGWKWYARIEGQTEPVFEGTTPEAAIDKLVAELGESAPIIYERTVRKHTVRTAIVDTEHCPVCGRPVVYANAWRPNGRFALLAFHEGELPEEAEIVDTVKPDYKKWLLKETLHLELKDPEKIHYIMKPGKTRAKKAEKTPEVESSPEYNTEEIVEIVKPSKEMVIIETRPAENKITEEDEAKPIADITGLKHNTFAIVGKVLQTLKENNWTDDKIKVARTDMTANGGKINDLFAIANKYVQVVEAGLPVVMDSGIPA